MKKIGLSKYEAKKNKNIFLILSFILVCVISLLIYQSYANYQMKATFRIINGKLKLSGGSGDVEFAFYSDDVEVTNIPLYKDYYEYSYSVCNNDATVEWDEDRWAPTVLNLTKSKTKCSLYFKKMNAGEFIASLARKDKTNLAYDDTDDNNLRYIGTKPKNYVYFNCEDGVEASAEVCETWRIIGVMNNIEDEDGNIGSHLKIIRDNFEAKYSWDSSLYEVNEGYGVNEWSEADIEKVLNDEYLYRRTGSNLCYKGQSNALETCPDWTNIGIKATSRNMIASVKWNTGTIDEAYSSNFSKNDEKFNTKTMYEAERNNHTGKELCEANGGGKGCNDSVARTTTWSGKVGLMYPSDYGYAVGGNVRETCLGKSIFRYNSDNCMTNDWLLIKDNVQWTMLPSTSSTLARAVFILFPGGGLESRNASDAWLVRPTLYLAPSVEIIGGSGDIGDPFVLNDNPFKIVSE